MGREGRGREELRPLEIVPGFVEAHTERLGFIVQQLASGLPFPVLVLVLGFVMILMSMAQRKERKKRDAMLKAIKKHDRVQTVGGGLGSIVEVKSDEVVLKVDESSNTRITFARSAIQQILSSGKNGAAASPADVKPLPAE